MHVQRRDEVCARLRKGYRLRAGNPIIWEPRASGSIALYGDDTGVGLRPLGAGQTQELAIDGDSR